MKPTVDISWCRVVYGVYLDSWEKERSIEASPNKSCSRQRKIHPPSSDLFTSLFKNGLCLRIKAGIIENCLHFLFFALFFAFQLALKSRIFMLWILYTVSLNWNDSRFSTLCTLLKDRRSAQSMTVVMFISQSSKNQLNLQILSTPHPLLHNLKRQISQKRKSPQTFSNKTWEAEKCSLSYNGYGWWPEMVKLQK